WHLECPERPVVDQGRSRPGAGQGPRGRGGTMAKEATGECRRLVDGFEARITIEGRRREGFRLVVCRGEDEARERTREMARLAARLRRAGYVAELPKLMEQAAAARAGRPWAAVVAAVDALCAGNAEDIANANMPTFADFADDWTSGKLHARHPDHVP